MYQTSPARRVEIGTVCWRLRRTVVLTTGCRVETLLARPSPFCVSVAYLKRVATCSYSFRRGTEPDEPVPVLDATLSAWRNLSSPRLILLYGRRKRRGQSEAILKRRFDFRWEVSHRKM